MTIWARGVVVSHPLSMREALGSIPSVSMSAKIPSLCMKVLWMHGYRVERERQFARVGRSADLPRTRAWDLWLRRPTPYPLGQHARCRTSRPWHLWHIPGATDDTMLQIGGGTPRCTAVMTLKRAAVATAATAAAEPSPKTQKTNIWKNGVVRGFPAACSRQAIGIWPKRAVESPSRPKTSLIFL